LNGGHSLAIVSQQQFDFDKSVKTLSSVLKDNQDWRGKLVALDTTTFERHLKEIISAMNQFVDCPSLGSSVVENIHEELAKEVNKLEKLEADVDALKAELAAKDVDAYAINFLMDVMHLLKNFIIRIEMKTGNYSAAFKKVNDRDAIEALFPVPLDILDSQEDSDRKTYLQSLNGDAVLLFSNLKLDAKVVFDLNKMVQHRNFGTHKLDNRQFKDATYVKQKLSEFSGVIKGLTAANVLEPNKDNINNLVESICQLHPVALQKMNLFFLSHHECTGIPI
jgi:ribosome-associated translation inhibitor RaiA